MPRVDRPHIGADDPPFRDAPFMANGGGRFARFGASGGQP